MTYATGSHTVFHHRYHIVWITKYRYKVLEGALRERIRTIIKQVCNELGVQIVSGALSKESMHSRARARISPEPPEQPGSLDQQPDRQELKGPALTSLARITACAREGRGAEDGAGRRGAS